MLPAPFAEPEVERGPWERRARRARRWPGSVEPGQTHPGRRCGKPRPATLCPSPRTTGEPTTGRTDHDFVNDVSEKEQRWGAKAMPGSGHQEHINQLSAMSISQSSPSAACRLTPSGGLEASLVSSWPEWTRTVTSVWKRPKCSSVRGEVQSVDTPQGTALPLLPATFSSHRPRTDSSVCVSSFPALMLQVIIQRPEYDKDILNSMRSLICLKLLYGP
ncbi:uncharacterized protein LOC122672948 [Cervus elaphus]|uniref:uncharacterized protein LOC122672948 n=1 Tax=Cervus elaphus TaxID=9860 RepID=UPI001CC2D2AB|nr:uncharacterized protein LOC122672948 [Cervus elaphus]